MRRGWSGRRLRPPPHEINGGAFPARTGRFPGTRYSPVLGVLCGTPQLSTPSGVTRTGRFAGTAAAREHGLRGGFPVHTAPGRRQRTGTGRFPGTAGSGTESFRGTRGPEDKLEPRRTTCKRRSSLSRFRRPRLRRRPATRGYRYSLWRIGIRRPAAAPPRPIPWPSDGRDISIATDTNNVRRGGGGRIPQSASTDAVTEGANAATC